MKIQRLVCELDLVMCSYVTEMKIDTLAVAPDYESCPKSLYMTSSPRPFPSCSILEAIKYWSLGMRLSRAPGSSSSRTGRD